MQFAPQGDRVASVWTQYLPDNSHELRMDVLHFDNATGVVSAPIGDTMLSTDQNDARYAYGVCFSPSGRFLYRTEYGLLGGIGYSKIMQYDLQAADPMNTEVEVGNAFLAYGSMQRAPDGSIYIARLNGAQYLSRITSPDLPGSQCGLVDQAASIAPNISTWGLPNHWDTYPEPIDFDPIAFTDTTICNSEGIALDATWPFPFSTAEYLWSTGETTPVITAGSSGEFTVEVQLPCTTYFDTVSITLRAIDLDLGPDLSICEGDSVLLSVDYEDVLWSTGDTSSTIFIGEDGLYSAEVSLDGCIFRDDIGLHTRNCECPFYIPNAFTPNEDGINDQWSPGYDCEPLSYDLTVFDRWGRELFRSDDPAIPWQGDVPIGVYNYMLRYSWDDGEKVRHKERPGHVALIR
jgi:gliding motility-associated-like protein